MRAPDFWRRPGPLPWLLSPLAALYGWGSERSREGVEAFRAAVPVICVGNIVAGGAGKTPVALALADWFLARGQEPHLLSRGYGGSEPGPCRVDPARHTAAQVGDEPLLLAAKAPTWVSRHRPEGAVAATKAGADLIIMDDGFQNATLVKTLSLVVADGGYGFGNGRVIPAGPCREPVRQGLARADALVVIGQDSANTAAWAGAVPVLGARLVPGPELDGMRDRPAVAFAGIGRPDKFFETLAQGGVRLIGRHDFPDHHPYGRAEVEALLDAARRQDARLITTAKDAVRVPADLRRHLSVLTVTLEWDDIALLSRILSRLDSSL